MGIPVQYAKNGDINIAYQIRSDGPTDLVFVAPWFSNLDLIDSYPPAIKGTQRFAAITRLIIYDRRGSGLSDRLCGQATLEESVDDLLAVLDGVGSERAALFGMNESGSVCMLAAATHPERVASLILYGTYATTLFQPDYPWAPRPEERDAEVQLMIDTWGTEGIAGTVNPSAADDTEFIEWVAKWMRGSVSKDALPRAYELLSKTDVRHVLPSIAVPTLVLHRTKDAVVPVDNARYLVERIPGAKLVELEGEDHVPFLGDYDAVMDEVEEFITGERPHREADRVLATILLADIVDSSEKAGGMGDAKWKELLGRFEQMVRSELLRYQGNLIKTTGDGALATFDGPARALRCGRAIVDRAKTLGLDLRAGIHTGEVERRGDDIAGIAVHIAARVSDLAGPSEVLVSGAVPPLVAGAGIAFEDRGTHQLKGIEGEWHVLRVAS
ncbi:MAG: adenylate/guanylate cyclase domain-containing protein [Actinomycetota bacterium]|nr:adenylate/guanylate cyclase domain-containing protein [Actinomycetota bacterium]